MNKTTCVICDNPCAKNYDGPFYYCDAHKYRVTQEMPKLKPCPFCGSGADVEMTLEAWNRDWDDMYLILCGEECNVGGSVECSDPDHLAAQWNNRPLEDALRKRIGELEEEARDAALDAQFENF